MSSSPEITCYQLNAACVCLKQFDTTASDSDFMEAAIWNNSEGFDVTLNSSSEQHFHLTWEQFKALKKLIKELHKHHDF